MLAEIIDATRFLEDPRHDGEAALRWLAARHATRTRATRIAGEKGFTDVVVAEFGEGTRCLGILGVLGGTGMRPERPGLVSDADGAVVALAVAAALGRQWECGDGLPGRVIVATHICPRALVRPQLPAPMMSNPADRVQVLDAMLDPAMQAVLSVDASKANRILNHTGFAITPTAIQGWVLRVADDLLDLQQAVTGEAPVVLPITTQDITPYGSGVRHINSIMQPATRTPAPVVGVALTAAATVAGSATGANQPFALDQAGRFCVEVARGFTAGRCAFHAEEELATLIGRYGSLERLQRL
ncbi:MAG: DUF1177 domain-containing protein [Acetobacteraceae bacterium]|nr:DUF1177 domain-containing protein [Acetobacteraceae bacterium]